MKKFNTIDLVKFIVSIFVIAGHTQLLSEEKYGLYSMIIRASVPFFFMAIGFLLEKKLINSKDKNIVYKDYIIKILKLYIIWSIIYLPISIYGMFTMKGNNGIFIEIIRLIKNYIFLGEQYYSWSLWYLLCTIYSILLLYIFNKLKMKKVFIFIISTILFILGYIYTYFALNSGNTYRIISLLISLIGPSGRILQGLFYINLGSIIYSKLEQIKKYKYIYLLIILIILLTKNYNLEILRIVFNINIFLITISINLKDRKIYSYLRKTGVIMYFTHMIIFFINSLIVGKNNQFGLEPFLVCLITTFIISIIVNYINKDKKIKVLNIIFN